MKQNIKEPKTQKQKQSPTTPPKSRIGKNGSMPHVGNQEKVKPNPIQKSSNKRTPQCQFSIFKVNQSINQSINSIYQSITTVIQQSIL